MAQGHKFQDLVESGDVLVEFINSTQLDKLKQVNDALHNKYDRHIDTKKTITHILQEFSQTEEFVGQTLLDLQEEQKQREKELNSLEEQLRQCTAKSQITDSELQLLQKEFKDLINNENELKTFQTEVDEDTTEVIPSAVYVAQLFHRITKFKWEFDTEPHILKGVHYGAELATPINTDKSTKSPDEVSDHLWSLIS